MGKSAVLLIEEGLRSTRILSWHVLDRTRAAVSWRRRQAGWTLKKLRPKSLNRFQRDDRSGSGFRYFRRAAALLWGFRSSRESSSKVMQSLYTAMSKMDASLLEINRFC